MALVDLSRFNPDIRQDNRQRQIFSNEGAEVYESLAKVSQGVADYAIDIVKKDRIKQHTDFQTKVASDLSESEAAFDVEWAIQAKNGVTRNAKGLSYLEAKNSFLKDKIDQAQQEAPDAGLFEEYRPTLEKYRSASTVDAIKQNYKIGMEASTFNWKKLGEESGRQFATLESGSYSAAWQKKKLELDAEYANTAVYSVSVADKNRKELEQGLANIIIDKNMNVDWKQHNLISVVNEIMPLEVSLSAATGRNTIKFLKEYAVNASPEELKIATDSYIELQKNNLLQAKENLQRNSRIPNSKISAKEFRDADAKLDQQIGKIEDLATGLGAENIDKFDMDTIDIEYTPNEAKAISRGDNGIWNSLTAEKQINYMSGILDWKAKSTGSSKADFDFQIKQWKANVTDLGSDVMTFRGYNRFTEGPNRIVGLMRENSSYVEGNEVRYTTDLYESIMDKLVLTNAFTPGIMAAKGWDAASLHQQAVAQLQSYNIPAINKGLASGAVGIAITAEYNIKQNTNFKKMRALAASNPMKALMLMGTDKFHKASNDILASGTFNSAAYNKMDTLAKREMAPFLGSTYRSKLDEQLVTPLLETLKNDIDTARASGDENYDRLVNKVLPKDPNTFATIMERFLITGTEDDKATARAIIFKRQHGTPTNQALTNDVLKANTVPELKSVKELIKKDESFKKKTETAREATYKLFSNFYSKDKGAVNPWSSAGAGEALTNYINSTLMSNQGQDPKEVAKRAFDMFYGNKLAVGTSEMRGTVMKKEGEDLSRLEYNSNKMLNEFKKELTTGKLEIDITGMPLTSDMAKAGVNFKTRQGFNKFLDYGFEIQLQTIDDTGNTRDVYPVILDKKTGAKYYIRDINKKLLKRSIP